MWAKLENIKGGILQPTVIELLKGLLLAYPRITNGGLNRGRIARSESKQYGLHWSTAIPTNLPNPNS